MFFDNLKMDVFLRHVQFKLFLRHLSVIASLTIVSFASRVGGMV